MLQQGRVLGVTVQIHQHAVTACHVWFHRLKLIVVSGLCVGRLATSDMLLTSYSSYTTFQCQLLDSTDAAWQQSFDGLLQVDAMRGLCC